MPSYGFTVKADGNVDEVMKKMQAAIEGMGATVTRVTKKVKQEFSGLGGWIKKSADDIAGSLKSAFAAFAIFEGVKSFLKMGSDAEQTAMSFEVFLGSAEAAKNMIGQLKQLANTTPLETSDVNEAAKTLLNFSIDANDVIGDIKMLGDVSGGNAEKLKAMTLAFGQASSNGKLMGQDLMQMINAGFNPLQEISRTTGQSMTDLKAKMEKGQITVKMMQDAFKSATGEGGKFHNMLNKQAQTLGGQWSTFIDGIKEPLLELFNILNPILKSILTNVTKAIEFLKGLFTSSSAGAQAFRVILLTVISALALYFTYQALVASWSAIVTAATWLWNAALAANPLVWIIAAILALVAAIMILWDKFEGFRAVIGGVFGFFKQEIMSTIHLFKNLGQIVWDIFTGQWKKAFEDGKKMISDFKNDITTGMVDAVKKGAEAAKNSDFKFGDLLKVNTGQTGPSQGFGAAGKNGVGGVKQNAINTSQLSGGKGGLGEAKVINIHIDTMQKVYTTDNRNLKERGQDSVEVMLRTVNNISYSQSQTQ